MDDRISNFNAVKLLRLTFEVIEEVTSLEDFTGEEISDLTDYIIQRAHLLRLIISRQQCNDARLAVNIRIDVRDINCRRICPDQTW